jgi:hypothetical protein
MVDKENLENKGPFERYYFLLASVKRTCVDMGSTSMEKQNWAWHLYLMQVEQGNEYPPILGIPLHKTSLEGD